MDVLKAYSLYKVFSGGANVVLKGASPVGFALTTVSMIKKWVDSECADLLRMVQQREGCPHIAMIEGSPPTPAAVDYVYENGGVAWRLGESSFYFWHPEATFHPMVLDWVMVRAPNGKVDVVRSRFAYEQSVRRPREGYGCRLCRESNVRRNS